MAVGDVNSNARGSGARFNDGKPDLSLIPLDIIAESFSGPFDTPRTATTLRYLGDFQRTGNVAYLDSALMAMRDSWPDCARVFEYGKRKYAAWNWAKGMAWSIPIACAARHALAELNGEVNDPESGLPHRGHRMCNLVMLRTFVETYPEGNDLPPPELFRAVSAPGPLDDVHPEEETDSKLYAYPAGTVFERAYGGVLVPCVPASSVITAHVPSLRD